MSVHQTGGGALTGDFCITFICKNIATGPSIFLKFEANIELPLKNTYLSDEWGFPCPWYEGMRAS